MANWTPKFALTQAVTDWQDRSVIDTDTAESLRADIAARGSGNTFQTVLILIAVICLGFAAVTFVAANWEVMPRLSRLAILVGSMWAAWAAAITFKIKDQQWIAECCTLLACGLFGASIMLISQMYHIQGDAADAVWLWAVGTVAGALAMRSLPALGLAVALFTTQLTMSHSIWHSDANLELMHLVYLGICAAIAYWLNSRFVGHLILLSLGFWVFLNAVDGPRESQQAFTIAALFATTSLLSALLYSEGHKNWLRGFERSTLFYTVGMLGLLMVILFFNTSSFLYRTSGIATPTLIAPVIGLAITGTFALLAARHNTPNRYDNLVTLLATALIGIWAFLLADVPFISNAVLLATSIWVVRMGWRMEHRALSVLGYIGFASAMLMIYFEAAGGLLGTAAFYLATGVIILAAVLFLPRLRKGDAS